MDGTITSQTREPANNPHDPMGLLAASLLLPTGVDGVYGRSGLYEDVVDGLSYLISRHRDAGTEVLRFPPVMSRHVLEKSGYLKSFPNLLGCVCALHGTETEIRAAADQHEEGGDWTSSLTPAELVLTPAACYPVYPMVARRGPIPVGGLRFDVACDCFRREPSQKLDRLQSFRMREYVCIGSPEEVAEFRERWLERGRRLAEQLELDCNIVLANDPFFGRAGQMVGISQRQQALKFELQVPLYSVEQATACMSFNYHRDHFGTVWGIRDTSHATAHTACVAFGMDRLAVALFWKHGPDVQYWPGSVRNVMGLQTAWSDVRHTVQVD
jgi:seryl-tRNA synthetase